MSLIVHSGKVLDGSTALGIGATFSTQPVNIAGRKNQTINVSVDKAIKYDVQVSFDSEDDADFMPTADNGIAVADANASVINVNYTANFMRLFLHDNVAISHPVCDIHSQPNV